MTDNIKVDLQNGLASRDVEKQRAIYGENVLTEKEPVPLWKLYLEKFQDPIIKVLLVTAMLSMVVAVIENDFVETLGILCAVFLATAIGFYFEYDAQKKFRALNAVDDNSNVKVRRDGVVQLISKRDIVVGDIVLLDSGDAVPADGELLEAVALMVNESNLTGESQTRKSVVPSESKCEEAYAQNVVLRGSTVISGTAVMCVTAVGDSTEMGKLAIDAAVMPTEETPLMKQLNRLAKAISWAGFTAAFVAFAAFEIHSCVNYFYIDGCALDGNGWMFLFEVTIRYFMMAVSFIVMAVPEGLPMAVTLSLALNARRMLKTNNLVRKMHACETLGAVTVVCTDKTGTLTQNRMQVVETVKAFDEVDENLLAEAVALNSTAELELLDGGKVRGIGNPTEAALLDYLRQKGYDYASLRTEVDVVSQIPFSTERKFMATLVESNCLSGRIVYVKGAPEVIMAMCSKFEGDDKVAAAVGNLQSQSLRTLSLAMKVVDDSVSDCAEAINGGGFRFMACFAIADPLRPDVKEAVADCRNAGVRVKVVTGDVVATAVNIARSIDLWNDCDNVDECAISGVELESLSDAELLERVDKIKVVYRARPADKKRLVQLLQRRGEVVAVTGDGTNDAPALNFAQVGVSLGSGTTVAKEASDVTLIDDSFKSLTTAIMWGRSLYKNIQRFLVFQLTINVSALLVVLLGAFIGTELPLTVTQMLWVNIIMDTFSAMALASLPPSYSVMREKPRCNSDFIITHAMRWNIAVWGVLFFVVMLLMILYYGEMSIHELTIFFTTFVMLQFWNLFNVRTMGGSESTFVGLFKCKGLLFVASMIFIGQWAIVQFGGKVFRTIPLSVTEWGVIIAGTSLAMWIGEVIRLVERKMKKR